MPGEPPCLVCSSPASYVCSSKPFLSPDVLISLPLVLSFSFHFPHSCQNILTLERAGLDGFGDCWHVVGGHRFKGWRELGLRRGWGSGVAEERG